INDFTLYFLAFDQGQNYKDMSEEERDKARFAREGEISFLLSLSHEHNDNPFLLEHSLKLSMPLRNFLTHDLACSHYLPCISLSIMSIHSAML
ncbi:hypothetical protein EV361DRAFT_918701, partial [Lentinula raphanica]